MLNKHASITLGIAVIVATSIIFADALKEPHDFSLLILLVGISAFFYSIGIGLLLFPTLRERHHKYVTGLIIMGACACLYAYFIILLKNYLA